MDYVVCSGTGDDGDDDEPQCTSRKLGNAKRCIAPPPAPLSEGGLNQPLPSLSLPSFSVPSRDPGSFAPTPNSQAAFGVCPQSQTDQHSFMKERARFDAASRSSHDTRFLPQPSSQAHQRGTPGMMTPAGYKDPLSISVNSGMSISTTMGSSALQSTNASSVSSQGSDRQVLNIFLGSGQWESIIFTRSEDLSSKVSEFIGVHKLSPLVKAGLITQLRQMIMMRQLSASVDIVDLF